MSKIRIKRKEERREKNKHNFKRFERGLPSQII